MASRSERALAPPQAWLPVGMSAARKASATRSAQTGPLEKRPFQ